MSMFNTKDHTYLPCAIFYLQVEIILHKELVFKQHINQYIQCVLAHITNMLKSGGGNEARMTYLLMFWVPFAFKF